MPSHIVIETFKLDADSAVCGYPTCCPGRQPRFHQRPFPNQYISEVLKVQTELDQLMDDARRIFKKTGIPYLPCMLHNCCCPVVPICFICGYERSRINQMDRLVNRWNRDIGMPKGVYLEWNEDFYDYFRTSKNTGEKYLVATLVKGLGLIALQLYFFIACKNIALKILNVYGQCLSYWG